MFTCHKSLSTEKNEYLERPWWFTYINVYTCGKLHHVHCSSNGLQRLNVNYGSCSPDWADRWITVISCKARKFALKHVTIQQGDEVFTRILSAFLSLIFTSACTGCIVNNVQSETYSVHWNIVWLLCSVVSGLGDVRDTRLHSALQSKGNRLRVTGERWSC